MILSTILSSVNFDDCHTAVPIELINYSSFSLHELSVLFLDKLMSSKNAPKQQIVRHSELAVGSQSDFRHCTARSAVSFYCIAVSGIRVLFFLLFYCHQHHPGGYISPNKFIMAGEIHGMMQKYWQRTLVHILYLHPTLLQKCNF